MRKSERSGLPLLRLGTAHPTGLSPGVTSAHPGNVVNLCFSRLSLKTLVLFCMLCVCAGMSVLQAGHHCALNVAVPVACSRRRPETPRGDVREQATRQTHGPTLSSESRLALVWRKRTKVGVVAVCVCVWWVVFWKPFLFVGKMTL